MLEAARTLTRVIHIYIRNRMQMNYPCQRKRKRIKKEEEGEWRKNLTWTWTDQHSHWWNISHIKTITAKQKRWKKTDEKTNDNIKNPHGIVCIDPVGELGSQSQSHSHLYKIQWDAALFPYEYWINCAIFWIKHHRLDFNSCVPFRVIVVSWWPRLNAHHSNLIQKKAIKPRYRNRDRESDTTSSLVYIFMAIHVKLLCNPLTYSIHSVSTEYTHVPNR